MSYDVTFRNLKRENVYKFSEKTVYIDIHLTHQYTMYVCKI